MSPFENQTYEALLANALARIDKDLDKREGSMVYNGIAPAMAELAQLYIGLDFVFTATYLATAPRTYLIARAKDRGLSPKAASAAVFRAEFDTEVPPDSRYSCEAFNFTVQERMTEADTETGLSYRVICETPGKAANDCTGDLIPIEYIAGLGSAKLVELLIPGDDEEETEVFRRRVLDSIQSQAFGGNVADYKAKVLALEGVSAVKVHPVWNGDIQPASLIPSEAVQVWYEETIDTIDNVEAAAWLTAIYTAALGKKLTVGGTVKLVVMAANHTAPSAELIELVQTTIDPTQNAGEGLGLAPIGHVVTVEGVTPVSVEVSTHLTFAAGYGWEDAKETVDAAVAGYFDMLAAMWDGEDALVVRIAQLESRILSEGAAYITDIGSTALNGEEENFVLGEDEIPVLASGGVEYA